MVIPQKVQGAKITAIYSFTQKNSLGETVVYNDQEVTSLLPYDSVETWKMGFVYTYIWHIEPHKIEFGEVQVEEWSEANHEQDID